MRNTFFSLCSEYHLQPKAFEREAVKETQQIKAFSLTLSRSSPYAGNDRSGWRVDGGENDAGKKVRMTCEDMLWLLPWLDSAGLIMDGLLCWQGLNTKSQRRLRPGCLLAVCIRLLLCFITAGGCIGLVEFHLGFETSFLTRTVSADVLWLTHFTCGLLAKHILWGEQMFERACSWYGRNVSCLQRFLSMCMHLNITLLAWS